MASKRNLLGSLEVLLTPRLPPYEDWQGQRKLEQIAPEDFEDAVSRMGRRDCAELDAIQTVGSS